MSKIVERREYRDCDTLLVAEVLDNGCVALRAEPLLGTDAPLVKAAVSSTVLRQLADMADAAKGA